MSIVAIKSGKDHFVKVLEGLIPAKSGSHHGVPFPVIIGPSVAGDPAARPRLA